MAALSAAAVADLQWVKDYLEKSNGLEIPFLDSKSLEVLARHYVEFGYTDQSKFLDEINSRPHWTWISIGLRLQ